MKIIYKNDVGGVSIIHPSDEALSTLSIEDIAEKDVPKGVDFRIVSDTDIPQSLTFREAWEVNDSEPNDSESIKVNLDVAKKILHDKCKNKRADLFKQLDINATTSAEAEASKQLIRNEFVTIQDEIDNAQTVDQLEIIIFKI